MITLCFCYQGLKKCSLFISSYSNFLNLLSQLKWKISDYELKMEEKNPLNPLQLTLLGFCFVLGLAGIVSNILQWFSISSRKIWKSDSTPWLFYVQFLTWSLFAPLLCHPCLTSSKLMLQYFHLSLMLVSTVVLSPWSPFHWNDIWSYARTSKSITVSYIQVIEFFITCHNL